MTVDVTPQTDSYVAVPRRFTTAGEDPLSSVEWDTRTATIGDVFKQEDVLFPRSWSQNATNIVAQKYFSKSVGEASAGAMIERVAGRITEEGRRAGYFTGPFDSGIGEAEAFHDELVHILLHQYASFNSPVWFNVGVEGRKQQISACFILAIGDSMQSILHWYAQEGMIFKGGSGSGINISNLRGSHEDLSTGGIASGPVSFMRAADANAGTIKSGGMTRRAAKMVILNADHPDIFEFVTCKSREEERLFLMLAAGIDLGVGDADKERVLAEVTSFQNANNSVRVTDEFMRLATGHRNGEDWNLVARTDGHVTENVRAAELLDEIAQAAWRCGDPGLQFDDTIQRYHTTPAQGRINGSNPCAEYLSNDDTSCNLASLNLLRFVRDDGSFDVAAYEHVVDVMAIAMDILVGFAHYPGDEEGELLGERTRKMRQLGMGYANLGALLMRWGLAYDSGDGRDVAAALASLQTARTYRRSALLAETMGPFDHYDDNAITMRDVLVKHNDQCVLLADSVRRGGPADALAQEALMQWAHAISYGDEHGYRNAQATLMAPTGTCSFMMDCITTGVEPGLALKTFKTLAGGGSLKIVNPLLPFALYELGYESTPAFEMCSALEQEGEAEFFDLLPEKHHQVFATALGNVQVSPYGHIAMLGAIQPHISGGISKTVNVPEDSTPEDIRGVYEMAWRAGVKCAAIYRDNSKATQILHTKPQAVHEMVQIGPSGRAMTSEEIQRSIAEQVQSIADGMEPERTVQRERMERTRDAVVHKFALGQQSGFLTAGKYSDGRPGEVFIAGFGKEGSTVSGLSGAWAKAVSIMLQYGVPVDEIAHSFAHIRFEPQGMTGNPEIPSAQSIPDYVARWLVSEFGDDDLREEYGVRRWEDEGGSLPNTARRVPEILTGRTCSECGGQMQRTGACYTCSSCGSNTGCG